MLYKKETVSDISALSLISVDKSLFQLYMFAIQIRVIWRTCQLIGQNAINSSTSFPNLFVFLDGAYQITVKLKLQKFYCDTSNQLHGNSRRSADGDVQLVEDNFFEVLTNTSTLAHMTIFKNVSTLSNLIAFALGNNGWYLPVHPFKALFSLKKLTP